MKTIYCIALEGGSVGGVEWRSKKGDRDAVIGTFGFEQEIPFEIEVEDDATREEITDAVDEAYWNKTYECLISKGG